MSEFKTAFNGRNMQHRWYMLSLIRKAAISITMPQRSNEFPAKVLAHLKSIGYIPKSVTNKGEALKQLVSDAVAGFGYVPDTRVKQAFVISDRAAARRAELKAQKQKVAV